MLTPGSAQGSAGHRTLVCVCLYAQVCPVQRVEVVPPGYSCLTVCPWQLCPGKCLPTSLRQQWAAGGGYNRLYASHSTHPSCPFARGLGPTTSPISVPRQGCPTQPMALTP